MTTIGMQMAAEDARFGGGLEQYATRAVTEQHASAAVGPVQHA